MSGSKHEWINLGYFKILIDNFTQSFFCLFIQVRVDGFDYVGCGNSTSKKDAQTNAAKDFCQYLVREGKLNAAEVPSIDVSIYSSRAES